MLQITRNISAILLSLLLHFYFYNSNHIQKSDFELYDFITKIYNKIEKKENSLYSVIVDIDEKSLQQFGQWPWPRIIDAQLIKSINDMKPSAISLNILFPERDRTSPISIQNFYKTYYDYNLSLKELPQHLRDNDKLLSQSIQNSGATLSTYFQNTFYTDPYCEKLSYKQNMFYGVKSEFKSTALLCNHPNIQENVENFGFANIDTDSDGIFRRILLFMEYKERIFPSLAVATLFSFDKFTTINTQESSILVNLSKKKPKIFSASDILTGNISTKDIEGKIVIIGSSVIGLTPTYPIANGKNISKSMINSFVIENILTDSFLVQPEKFKLINIFISFLLSIFIILFLYKKLYIHIIKLFFITIGISSFFLGYFYMIDGVYISIGYLWVPLLYFSLSILAYHAIIIYKERQEQEKILIRQSKLASMGEMISLIAHQWRQPLSAINGIVMKLDVDHRKNILNHKKMDEYLNEIEDTTAYLSKTINDFTDFFSKNKTSDIFNIQDVIVQAAHLTPISNYNNIHISYRKKENIEIKGYKSELIQSLLVILNNALYACQKNLLNREKGRIIIDTYTLKEDLFISIEDNGGGINNKNLKNIFNPYFTTKEKPHGTGLGLYILKLIVEDSMNGKISVQNSEEGAVFTIQIPINMK